jgi:LysM repeat protein
LIIHVVKSGESLYSIAKRYGVPYEKVVRDNELETPNKLVVGQTIVILEGERQHRVAPGESIYSIARKYGVTANQILAANPQITNPATIKAGQTITIPEKTTKLGTIEVNGYTFPNTSLEIIRKTLPYLTYLSIFSHEVNPNGTLRPINDEPLIRAARQARVAPLMVITNMEAGGGFSSDVARSILRNEGNQDRLINNVINNLKSKNYYGLDIDFAIRNMSRKLRLMNEDPSNLEIGIDVRIEGAILAGEADKELYDSELLRRIEKELGSMMEERCRLVIKKLQKEYNVDALLINDYLKKFHPSAWDSVKDKWDDVYPGIKITPVNQVRVRRIGTVK